MIETSKKVFYFCKMFQNTRFCAFVLEVFVIFLFSFWFLLKFQKNHKIVAPYCMYTYDVCKHHCIMYIFLQSIHFFFKKPCTIISYSYTCCEWLICIEHKQCSILANCSLERVVKIWKCLRVIGAIAWPISVYWVKMVAWVNCTDTQLFAFTWETQEIRASCVQSPNSERDSHYAKCRKIKF